MTKFISFSVLAEVPEDLNCIEDKADKLLSDMEEIIAKNDLSLEDSFYRIDEEV